MPLLSRHKEESDPKVTNARLQIDLAVLKMTDMLDRVEEQVNKARKELNDMRTED